MDIGGSSLQNTKDNLFTIGLINIIYQLFVVVLPGALSLLLLLSWIITPKYMPVSKQLRMRKWIWILNNICVLDVFLLTTLLTGIILPTLFNFINNNIYYQFCNRIFDAINISLCDSWEINVTFLDGYLWLIILCISLWISTILTIFWAKLETTNSVDNVTSNFDDDTRQHNKTKTYELL